MVLWEWPCEGPSWEFSVFRLVFKPCPSLLRPRVTINFMVKFRVLREIRLTVCCSSPLLAVSAPARGSCPRIPSTSLLPQARVWAFPCVRLICSQRGEPKSKHARNAGTHGKVFDTVASEAPGCHVCSSLFISKSVQPAQGQGEWTECVLGSEQGRDWRRPSPETVPRPVFIPLLSTWICFL